jgi:hypothetical protein
MSPPPSGFDFGENDKRERDRLLRWSLLLSLFECMKAPMAGVGGRTLYFSVQNSAAEGLGFESEAHGMQLIRSLENRGYASVEVVGTGKNARAAGRDLTPDNVFVRITARGEQLHNWEIPADPGIADGRGRGNE